jgi:hypothetical protein
MKTIIENTTKQSKYLLDDNEQVFITGESITVGQPPQFIIADLNSTNATLIEGVSLPDDYVGCKYLYDAGEWTLNPDWVDFRVL